MSFFLVPSREETLQYEEAEQLPTIPGCAVIIIIVKTIENRDGSVINEKISPIKLCDGVNN